MISGGGFGCFKIKALDSVCFNTFLLQFYAVIEFTILRAVMTLAARRTNGFTAITALRPIVVREDHFLPLLFLNPPKRPFFFG